MILVENKNLLIFHSSLNAVRASNMFNELVETYGTQVCLFFSQWQSNKFSDKNHENC